MEWYAEDLAVQTFVRPIVNFVLIKTVAKNANPATSCTRTKHVPSTNAHPTAQPVHPSPNALYAFQATSCPMVNAYNASLTAINALTRLDAKSALLHMPLRTVPVQIQVCQTVFSMQMGTLCALDARRVMK
jgi:hypothetical protein